MFDSKTERMEWALKLMCASGRCQHYTSGLGACFRAGRTAEAEHLADRACTACVANYALHGRVRGGILYLTG